MRYKVSLLTDFLKEIIAFDDDCRMAIKAASSKVKDSASKENDKWQALQSKTVGKAGEYASNIQSVIEGCKSRIEKALTIDLEEKREIFRSIQRCREKLSVVQNAEMSIIDKEAYAGYLREDLPLLSTTLDDILQEKMNLIEKAREVNEALKLSDEKEAEELCASFYSSCRAAEVVLNDEILRLQDQLMKDLDALHEEYERETPPHEVRGHIGRHNEIACGDGGSLKEGNAADQSISEAWEAVNTVLSDASEEFAAQWKNSQRNEEEEYELAGSELKKQLEKRAEQFLTLFSPEELYTDYKELYAMETPPHDVRRHIGRHNEIAYGDGVSLNEPSYVQYVCCAELPHYIRLGKLEYDLSELRLCAYTKSFLRKYYYYIYRDNKLFLPYCLSLDEAFSILFRFRNENRMAAVRNACELGMRLFMMLPPGKLKVTCFDPVTLGESFAIFPRLVHMEDSTSEVIHGRIWSGVSELEARLEDLTVHISDVIQRCLQGRYETLYEYNCEAGKNAVPYELLILMDFPAGCSEQSLKLLEQIVSFGPKCGVFTIIYHNADQYKKASGQVQAQAALLEKKFERFDYSDDGSKVICSGVRTERPVFWEGVALPEEIDTIIMELQKGIAETIS